MWVNRTFSPVFRVPDPSRSTRSRLPSFVKLEKTITAQRPGIVAAIESRHRRRVIEEIHTLSQLFQSWVFGDHIAQGTAL